MTTLADINPNTPTIKNDPQLFAQLFRSLAAAIIGSFEIEHQLTGEHKILVGPVSSRPAYGHSGRFYIQTLIGNPDELLYDTGAAWVNLTNNATYAPYVPLLAAHIAAVPIDHPNVSVTAAKIALGAILKRHLDGSGDATSIADLVNAANADALHKHDQYLTAGSSAQVPAGSVTPDKLSDLSAATYIGINIITGIIIGQAPTERSVNYADFTKVKEIQIHRSGIITVSVGVGQGEGGGGNDAEMQVWKNSYPLMPQPSFTIPGTSVFDLAGIVSGDLIQIYARGHTIISNFFIYANWDTTTNTD